MDLEDGTKSNLTVKNNTLSPKNKWSYSSTHKKVPWKETRNVSVSGMNPYVDGVRSYGNCLVERKRVESKEMHRVVEAIKKKSLAKVGTASARNILQV